MVPEMMSLLYGDRDRTRSLHDDERGNRKPSRSAVGSPWKGRTRRRNPDALEGLLSAVSQPVAALVETGYLRPVDGHPRYP